MNRTKKKYVCVYLFLWRNFDFLPIYIYHIKKNRRFQHNLVKKIEKMEKIIARNRKSLKESVKNND